MRWRDARIGIIALSKIWPRLHRFYSFVCAWMCLCCETHVARASAGGEMQIDDGRPTMNHHHHRSPSNACIQSHRHIVSWARMAVEYIFNDRNVMSILCVHCTWFTLMVNYNFSTRHRQMIIVRWHWNHCRRSDNGNTIQVHFELGMSVAASNLTQSSSHGINLTSTTFHIHSRSRYIAVN